MNPWFLTPTISRLIRERKVWEIPPYLQEDGIFEMQTFNQSTKLFREEEISIEGNAFQRQQRMSWI